MIFDDEGLKARIEEATKSLDFYLLHYWSLIGSGYSKKMLDQQIKELEKEIKELGRWT